LTSFIRTKAYLSLRVIIRWEVAVETTNDEGRPLVRQIDEKERDGDLDQGHETEKGIETTDDQGADLHVIIGRPLIEIGESQIVIGRIKPHHQQIILLAAIASPHPVIVAVF
jgi:hypothetical protein